MKHRDVEKRLEALEWADRERQDRVYTRVVQQLSDAEHDSFFGFMERERADPAAEPTAYELSVMRHMDTLARADREYRVCDLMGV